MTEGCRLRLRNKTRPYIKWDISMNPSPTITESKNHRIRVVPYAVSLWNILFSALSANMRINTQRGNNQCDIEAILTEFITTIIIISIKIAIAASMAERAAASPATAGE